MDFVVTFCMLPIHHQVQSKTSCNGQIIRICDSHNTIRRLTISTGQCSCRREETYWRRAFCIINHRWTNDKALAEFFTWNFFLCVAITTGNLSQQKTVLINTWQDPDFTHSILRHFLGTNPVDEEGKLRVGNGALWVANGFKWVVCSFYWGTENISLRLLLRSYSQREVVTADHMKYSVLDTWAMADV